MIEADDVLLHTAATHLFTILKKVKKMTNVYQRRYQNKAGKMVSLAGTPKLTTYFYVIEITTPHEPGIPLEIRFNRPLVFSNDTFLGISLKSYNGEHIFRIMYIIKSQTSKETLVTL